MTMTREQRIARANEIFAHVWGPDPESDELASVADELMTEFRNVADDLSAALEALAGVRNSLIDAIPLADVDESVADNLDVMSWRMGDIQAWVGPMRELADRMGIALENHAQKAKAS